jgi:S-formylglutathione hydrolase FrmB
VPDEIESAALKGNLLGDPATRPMWVWLPPGYDSSPEKRYPVIYLLHGFTGDHNQFKNSSLIDLNIGEIASKLIADGSVGEFIAVMPDASNVYGGSFYASNDVIGDYRSYIGRDLVDYIDSHYRTIPDRDHRHIAGNSMGARGALSIAMQFPDRFGSVAAMSPGADYAVAPTRLDRIRTTHPDFLGEPILVRTTEERRALLRGAVLVNLLYAEAAAFSPNPDNPPYHVDLPLRYPEKTVVTSVWDKWLSQDAVSEIERTGDNLKHTAVFIDIGTGPATIMPEGNDIQYLRDALDRVDIDYTFIESPGDHLSHLKERTAEVIKFVMSPDTYSAPKR